MLTAFAGATVSGHWGVAFTAIEFGGEQILVFTADSARSGFVFLYEMLHTEEKIIVDNTGHSTRCFGPFVEIVPNVAFVMEYTTDAILIELLTTGSTDPAIVEIPDNVCCYFTRSIPAKNLTHNGCLVLINIELGKYEGGSTAKTICAEYGVSRSTLLLWAKQYSADSNGQIPREQYLIRKELERLRIENQIYKECGCSANSSLGTRLDAIHRLKDKYSIHALCRVLNVNRSTVYHHESRAPEKTQVELQDEILKPLIVEIFETSNELFGVRRMRVKLKEKGDVVSEKRIGRLMKELGLYVKKNGPRLNSANDRQYQYYPNRLQRNFLTEAPNMVWVSDITYARVGHDFLYLCVVIDLYSRKVVSYAVSEYIDENIVSEAFESAYKSRMCPKGLLFHSDQGAQYTAFDFRKKLREYGVTQSFSAPGNPYDNAVVESFFASIKKEDFRKNFYKTEAEFKIAVAKYIDFYNDYRPHQRLGYLTPNQAEEEYYKSHPDESTT